MSSASYDIIIVGAGQNGLVAAAYLAKAGRRVLVLERREVVGGAHATEEFHPGFRIDRGLHRTGWLDPAMAAELSLGGATADIAYPDPCVFTPLGNGGFSLRATPREAVEDIRQHSAKDAEKWDAFCRLMHKLSGFLQHIYGTVPPALTSTEFGDLITLLGLGRRVRGMGKTDMIELLRILPMSVAELLDDWFESDVLKGTIGAGGITGVCHGPRSAGTAFVMLHHQVGNAIGAFRTAGLRRGGAGSLGRKLADAARGFGAEVRMGTAVRQILVTDGKTAGVLLENGDAIASSMVLSTADPRRTLLGLVDPIELEPDFTRAVQNIRYRGVVARINLALGELPRFGGEGDDRRLRGVISVSPNLDYLERAYDDAKHGGISRVPYLEAVIPSLTDPTMAPPGKHVMSISMQYAPYRLKQGSWDAATRESLGDRVVECLGAYAPNLKSAIIHREVLTPRDLEDTFSATEGNLDHGELALDQILFMRPVPGWAHYQTPIDGLFLGSVGTHPGSAVAGGSGRLAAKQMLQARKASSEKSPM
jgi:phytoene dehydrogenase-like protein